MSPVSSREEVLAAAANLRWEVGPNLHDSLMEALYTDAARISDRVLSRDDSRPAFDLDRTIDRLVTSRWLGFPIMMLLMAVVLWITIAGANVPSKLLSSLFLETLHPALKQAAGAAGLAWWLDGLLIDGMFLAMAWVVSVMLPPMAIFFPLFTLLEDFGYLPRVAFNLDRWFKKAGAHGKQALTMAMGYGCNAAGVVATRVIDSPRERLIATVTNNFSLCNGRWPTQILIATIFIGSLAPPALAGLVSAGAVMGVVLFGVACTFLVSWGLSRTLLRGGGIGLQPGAAPLPPPPHPPDRLHLPHRPHPDRALEGGDLFGAGRRRHLAGVQPSGRRPQPGGTSDPGNGPLRDPHRAERRHPVGLYHRHTRQRDRHPLRADADRAERRAPGGGRRRRGHVRVRFGFSYPGSPGGRWLDAADRNQPDAVQPVAQPLLHHPLHHLEGDRKRQVDDGLGAPPHRHGLSGLFLRVSSLPLAGRLRGGGFRGQRARPLSPSTGM